MPDNHATVTELQPAEKTSAPLCALLHCAASLCSYLAASMQQEHRGLRALFHLPPALHELFVDGAAIFLHPDLAQRGQHQQPHNKHCWKPMQPSTSRSQHASAPVRMQMHAHSRQRPTMPEPQAGDSSTSDTYTYVPFIVRS